MNYDRWSVLIRSPEKEAKEKKAGGLEEGGRENAYLVLSSKVPLFLW